MTDAVASAVVQEAVSRAISFVFGNREDQAQEAPLPQQALDLHRTERLEMAVSEVEFVLERTAKLPITDLSLLNRRKIFKLAYAEGKDLLNRHRHGGHGGDVARQPMKRSKIWMTFTRHANDSSVSSSATSSTNAVRRFEWLAELAGKFLRDVESGCSLQQQAFCNPLVRHLLEGKTLRYEKLELGGIRRRYYMWPICVEGRGVETMLEYRYEDYTTPEKCFHLALVVRISESTDILGTAVKCLRSTMARQFKVATETAAGELTLMATNSQLVSDSHHAPPPWAGAEEESHTKYSLGLRPDPVCCKDDYCATNNVASELSRTIPEQVILFSFGCYIVSADLRSSSSNEVGVMSDRTSPLELIAVFAPHFAFKEDQPQKGYALEILGDGAERKFVSLQELAKTIRSKATSSFLHQPKLKGYAVSWTAKHGLAVFDVQKARTQLDPKASGSSRYQRNSKRMQ